MTPMATPSGQRCGVRRCSTTDVDVNTSIEEAWLFECGDGTRLSLALRYVCGAPAYGRRDFRIYSGARPRVLSHLSGRAWRRYHHEQATRARPHAVFGIRGDRAAALRLFDDSAQLISIAALPWTRREVWLD